MLHSVVHDNRSKLWCGPAAIALLTGQPTSVIHQLVLEDRRESGYTTRFGVTWMVDGELGRVMRRLGYAAAEVPAEIARRRPLAHVVQALRAQPHRWSLPISLHLGGHYAVVFEGLYADNSQLRPGQVPPAQAGELVCSAWSWVRVHDPLLPASRADGRRTRGLAAASKATEIVA